MVSHNDLLYAVTGQEPCRSAFDQEGNKNDVDKWVGNWTNSTEPEVAEALCEGCNIREVCLQYALDNEEKDFIWGGTTPAQRKEILKSARRQPAKETSDRPVDNPKSTDETA